MRAVLMTLAFGLIVAPGVRSAAAQPPPVAPADIELFTSWLTGEFDNFQQISEQKENKVAAPHARIHTTVTRLVAPALGDRVFLARQSPRNNPDIVGTAYVYTVTASGSTITLRRHAFADPGVVVAAVNASPGAALPLESVRAMPGCDVTWVKQSGAFVGTMAPGTCRVAEATLTGNYRLTADAWAATERTVGEGGRVLSAPPGDVPYDLRRARPFNCWAALRKEGSTDKYDGMFNVAMHDQGKWVDFKREDATGTPFSFELSQLRYGQKVPVMKLAVYEAGKEQAVAYTWTEPSGTRIGVNLRWIQVGCSLKE